MKKIVVISNPPAALMATWAEKDVRIAHIVCMLESLPKNRTRMAMKLACAQVGIDERRGMAIVRSGNYDASDYLVIEQLIAAMSKVIRLSNITEKEPLPMLNSKDFLERAILRDRVVALISLIGLTKNFTGRHLIFDFAMMPVIPEPKKRRDTIHRILSGDATKNDDKAVKTMEIEAQRINAYLLKNNIDISQNYSRKYTTLAPLLSIVHASLPERVRPKAKK